MLQEFHDSDFTFETIWDRLVSDSGYTRRQLRTLDQVGQALGARALGDRSRDDLYSAILVSVSVPDDAHSRTASFADCLT